MTTRLASCSCGKLTAKVRGEPVRVSVCHCLACQRRSGSVFAAQARFRHEDVSLHGHCKTFVRIGDEGGRASFHFCPDCGATVWYTISGDDDVIAIPVGAFADPTFPGPSFSVYEERMHRWVVLPPGIAHMD